MAAAHARIVKNIPLDPPHPLDLPPIDPHPKRQPACPTPTRALARACASVQPWIRHLKTNTTPTPAAAAKTTSSRRVGVEFRLRDVRAAVAVVVARSEGEVLGGEGDGGV